LRPAQHNLPGTAIHKIDQTSIATGDLDCQADQFLEHFLQAEIGADNITNLVQQLNLTFGF